MEDKAHILVCGMVDSVKVQDILKLLTVPDCVVSYLSFIPRWPNETLASSLEIKPSSSATNLLAGGGTNAKTSVYYGLNKKRHFLKFKALSHDLSGFKAVGKNLKQRLFHQKSDSLGENGNDVSKSAPASSSILKAQDFGSFYKNKMKEVQQQGNVTNYQANLINDALKKVPLDEFVLSQLNNLDDQNKKQLKVLQSITKLPDNIAEFGELRGCFFLFDTLDMFSLQGMRLVSTILTHLKFKLDTAKPFICFQKPFPSLSSTLGMDFDNVETFFLHPLFNLKLKETARIVTFRENTLSKYAFPVIQDLKKRSVNITFDVTSDDFLEKFTNTPVPRALKNLPLDLFPATKMCYLTPLLLSLKFSQLNFQGASKLLFDSKRCALVANALNEVLGIFHFTDSDVFELEQFILEKSNGLHNADSDTLSTEVQDERFILMNLIDAIECNEREASACKKILELSDPSWDTSIQEVEQNGKDNGIKFLSFTSSLKV